MYASNEDEEWVYLTPTPTLNHVVPDEFDSSSSSSSSCSSRSERSTSVSSIDENSFENNDDVKNVLRPVISTEPTLLTDDEETKICAINRDTDQPNKTIFFSRTFSSSSETSHSRRFRSNKRRTNSNDHPTDFSRPEEIRSTSIFSSLKLTKSDRQYQNKDETVIAYIFMVILFVLPFFLGYSVSRWNQPTIEKIFNELDRVNQRLNGLSSTPTEQALLAQVNTLTLQIQQLQEDLHRTAENLSFRIHQLTMENHRLRLQSKINEENPSEEFSNDDSAKSFTEKIFKTFLHKTIFIADETSTHLGDVFHRLSASVTTLFDQCSSSLHWLKSWQQKRKESTTNTNSGRKYPCRWTFSKTNQCDDQRFPSKQIRSIQNWVAKIIRR